MEWIFATVQVLFLSSFSIRERERERERERKREREDRERNLIALVIDSKEEGTYLYLAVFWCHGLICELGLISQCLMFVYGLAQHGSTRVFL